MITRAAMARMAQYSSIGPASHLVASRRGSLPDDPDVLLRLCVGMHPVILGHQRHVEILNRTRSTPAVSVVGSRRRLISCSCALVRSCSTKRADRATADRRTPVAHTTAWTSRAELLHQALLVRLCSCADVQHNSPLTDDVGGVPRPVADTPRPAIRCSDAF